MISGISLLNGICAFLVILASIYFIILGIQNYRKTKVLNNLIFYLGLGGAIFIGWLGITISFFTVSIYGENINLPLLTLIANITAFAPEPIGSLSVINSNWSLAGEQEHKKLALGIFVGYSIFYWIILVLTFNQAILCPAVPTGEILNNWINPFSLFYYVYWGMIVIAGIITFIGFYKFRKSAPGTLRKRGTYVMLASCFIVLGILLDTVIFTDSLAYQFDFISRLLIIPGLVLIHLGYRPLK